MLKIIVRGKTILRSKIEMCCEHKLYDQQE